MDSIPLISIIVPVYKVENYLDDCINSILTQTYDNYELILVDDGSPDNCGNICDMYAAKDNRIFVIHKTNGGLSDARNKGIEIANGEYLTFIDSDDYIADNYLEYLVSAAIKYNADIVEGGHTSRTDLLGTIGNDRLNKPYDKKVYDRIDALSDYLLYKTMYANAWSKLYRTNLFKEVRYPIDRLTEDEYTTYKTIIKASTIVCLPQKIYFYRIREGSIVRSFSERRFDVCNELPHILENDLKEIGMYKKNEVNYKIMRVQLKIYNDFVQGKAYKNYKNQLDNIQSNIRRLPTDFKTWNKRYIIMKIMISYFPWVYRWIVLARR